LNRGEQKTFVRELADALVREVCEKIDEGKIPEHWDGHELRVLMSEKFEQSAKASVIRTSPRHSRARDYHNTVLTKYLT
jgi:hypothetical protein